MTISRITKISIKNIRAEIHGSDNFANLVIRVEGLATEVAGRLVQTEVTFVDINGKSVVVQPSFPRYGDPLGNLYGSTSKTPAANVFDLSTYPIVIPMPAIPMTTIPKQDGTARIQAIARVFVSHVPEASYPSELISVKW